MSYRPAHRYRIIARDPSGEFVAAWWRTDHLPRKGERVFLPDGTEGGQELEVEEVAHTLDGPQISLAGAEGWSPESVAALFAAATEWEERGRWLEDRGEQRCKCGASWVGDRDLCPGCEAPT